jgi:hypothetical protein
MGITRFRESNLATNIASSAGSGFSKVCIMEGDFIVMEGHLNVDSGDRTGLSQPRVHQ